MALRTYELNAIERAVMAARDAQPGIPRSRLAEVYGVSIERIRVIEYYARRKTRYQEKHKP